MNSSQYKANIQQIFEHMGNCCPHYEDCRSGVRYKNCEEILDKFLFDRARIGNLYGEDSVLPRIVMVGIEGFSDERIVSKVTEPSDDATNAHYRGVKYVLAYLLADFMGHEKPEPKITKSGVFWIKDALKRYCLCNLYKCAFVPKDDPDRATDLCHSEGMTTHCIDLLIQELNILDPHIVVIQASDTGIFTDYMRTRLFNTLSCKPIKVLDDRKAALYEGVINQKPLFLILTMHGANGGMKSHEYLQNKLNLVLDETLKCYRAAFSAADSKGDCP